MSKFAKAFLIYGLASAVAKFFGFILTPIYTRLFSPADYGVIDLLTAAVYVMNVLAALEIWAGVSRDYASAVERSDRTTLVSTGLWGIVIGSAVMVVVGVLVAGRVNDALFHSEVHRSTYLVAVATIPAATLFTYFNILMRFENKPWVFLGGMLVQVVVTTGVTLSAILIWHLGVMGFFLGQVIGNAAGIALFVYSLRRYIRPLIDPAVLRKILAFSIPVIPAILGIWINSYSSRFLMLKFLSVDDIGIYAVALKISSIFMFVEYAFRLAWTPYFYEMIEQEGYEKRLSTIYAGALLGLTLSVIVVALFSKEVLAFLAPEKYHAGVRVAGLLCVPAVLSILNQIVGVGSLIVRKTGYDSVANIAGMAVNVATMFFTIPSWGLFGAAASFAAGGLTTFGLYWYFSWKLKKLHFPVGVTVLLLGAATATAIVTGVVGIPLLVRGIGAAVTAVAGILVLRHTAFGELLPMLQRMKNSARER